MLNIHFKKQVISIILDIILIKAIKSRKMTNLLNKYFKKLNAIPNLIQLIRMRTRKIKIQINYFKELIFHKIIKLITILKTKKILIPKNHLKKHIIRPKVVPNLPLSVKSQMKSLQNNS